MVTDYIIGVDFDNTIVSYDNVMYDVALRRGLIHSDTIKAKRHIRDSIRQLPNGEIEWQRLQGIVYGPKMGEARLIEGVSAFFESCKSHGAKVYVISHKSEYANLDETMTDLRVAALTWMRANKFFEQDGLGLSQEDVYFESTRQEKLERIRHLKCTHFIDDLEEIFLERAFPANVEKILYAERGQTSSSKGVVLLTTWQEISNHLFKATGW